MLDRAKLEALRNAALADDWSLAGDLYIELGRDAAQTPEDRFKVEALALYVRFRNREALAAVVDELLAFEPE